MRGEDGGAAHTTPRSPQLFLVGPAGSAQCGVRLITNTESGDVECVFGLAV